ncbi:MAG: hypothetical protein NTY13_05595 [Chlamydiae bacterium]|nr:hypothetical protein [Chlamydiota bacterium]
MDFEELQSEMNTIIKDVKKAIDLPIDAEGKLPSGAYLSLGDLEKLLERTQGILDRLNNRAIALAEQQGMSREEMIKFTENPANFNQAEWEAIKSMKKQVDQFQKLLMKTVVSQQDRSSASVQPAKSTFSKKNWIPL